MTRTASLSEQLNDGIIYFTDTRRKIKPENIYPVYKVGAEMLSIFTARYIGDWVAGYEVVFADGSRKRSNPTPSRGVFRMERHALVYILWKFITIDRRLFPIGPEAERLLKEEYKRMITPINPNDKQS